MKTVSQNPSVMTIRGGGALRRGTAVTAIPLIIALAGSMTACGGGNQKAAPQAPATTATTAAAPHTAAPASPSAADDRETARRLVLTKADFPAGWKAARSAGGSVSFDHASGTTRTYTADVTGKELQRGDQAADSSVQIVGPGEDHAMDAGLLRTSKFMQTYKSELRKGIAQGNPGASIGGVTVKRLQVPKAGQYAVGYSATMRFKVQGFGVSVYLDWVWLANRRAAITVAFTNMDHPFDPTLRDTLIAKLDARLAAATT